MALFKTPNIDFVGLRWPALAVSVLVIAVGLAVTVVRGSLPLGIDFSGGSLIILKFEQPVGEGAVRVALAMIPEKVIQQYGDIGDNEVLVRLPISGPEEGVSLEAGANDVMAALEGGEFAVRLDQTVAIKTQAECPRGSPGNRVLRNAFPRRCRHGKTRSG